jgi:hypothetical protein
MGALDVSIEVVNWCGSGTAVVDTVGLGAVLKRGGCDW